MTPNIVIFKVDGDLYESPITGNGDLIGEAISFDSDYEMEENVIVFSSFDTATDSSVEIKRFSISEDQGEKAVTIKSILDEDDGIENLKKLVKMLFLTETDEGEVNETHY